MNKLLMAFAASVAVTPTVMADTTMGESAAMALAVGFSNGVTDSAITAANPADISRDQIDVLGSAVLDGSSDAFFKVAQMYLSSDLMDKNPLYSSQRAMYWIEMGQQAEKLSRSPGIEPCEQTLAKRQNYLDQLYVDVALLK